MQYNLVNKYQRLRGNLCPEDGVSKFFRGVGTYPHHFTLNTGYRYEAFSQNIGVHVSNYTSSHPRSEYSSQLPPRYPQNKVTCSLRACTLCSGRTNINTRTYFISMAQDGAAGSAYEARHNQMPDCREEVCSTRRSSSRAIYRIQLNYDVFQPKLRGAQLLLLRHFSTPARPGKILATLCPSGG